MRDIKLDKKGCFDKLCELEGRIRAKKGRVGTKSSVGMKKGVGKEIEHIISSTSTQETLIAWETIIE